MTFVDGAMISNFPLDLFHDTSSVPLWPTFGVRLGKHTAQMDTADPVSLFLSAFAGSRAALDRVYLDNNTDKDKVTTTIELTNEFFWLDFDMEHSKKVALFRAGAEAAQKFLTRSATPLMLTLRFQTLRVITCALSAC